MLELLLTICLLGSIGKSVDLTPSTTTTTSVIDDTPEPFKPVVVDDGVPF